MLTFIPPRIRLADLALALSALAPTALVAQVYLEPAFPLATDTVTVFYDASEGNGALADFAGDVYVHTGVITPESQTPSDWQNVATEWATSDPAYRLTPVPGEPDLYSIRYHIPTYYDLPDGTVVEQLAFVFRNADGSVVGRGPGGADIYYDVYDPADGFQLRVQRPLGSLNIVEAGDSIHVLAAASEEATFRLLVDGDTEVAMGSGRAFKIAFAAAAGSRTYVVEATPAAGAAVRSEAIAVLVPENLEPATAPAGLEYGLRRVIETDSGRRFATFYLFAPEKRFAFVNTGLASGEEALQQLTPTPEGDGFWTTMELSPRTDDSLGLVYQYIVEGGDPIADPFSELILDPTHDPFIEEETFPGIPEIPGLSGPATWVRPPGADDHEWRHDGYERPEAGELVIYELLIRDFVAAHDYATVIDSLGYLARLGVNAIELMPINEFSGNDSWGYNPTYHHALDKYYGPPEDLKALVDSAHALGMAVIVDVVFNQGDNGNPFYGIYSAERAAAPDGAGPFFNQRARHPFNVFNDFNHESPYVQAYVGQTVRDWIDDYHIDGYRFDLSKGFTQVDYGDDVGAWGRYDQSRIDILTGYRDSVWAADPEAYVILEHFAENREEQVLTEAGMYVWGNMQGAYAAAAEGRSSDLYGVLPESRGFESPRLIGYMESHDEERILHEVRTDGRTADDYSTRTDEESLRRMELISAFFYTLPGAKMLWQFGEYGYDVPIDENGRTGRKPIRWDLLDDPAHRRLYDVTRGLIGLRAAHPVFREGEGNYREALGASLTRALTLRHPEMDAVVVGNFDLTARDISAEFPNGGTYYSYFTGDSLALGGDADTALALAPGVFRVYTSERLGTPPGGFLTEPTVSTREVAPGVHVRAYPNPTAGQLFVEAPEWRVRSVSIELIDPTGRLVLRAAGSPADRIALDLSRLARGTYRLVVAGDDGRRVALPIVR